ncbi:DNA-processing protein DprA [Lyticum sinuosum]|uniref:DNA-processing protein DprA n=1 Tax=Lyticum sinuosum TaxID=1332059 RepID=A0AAE4VLU1_9RICK|nr:DNA-processing protein DprA [Lyticum sinuosum]MDZ5760854.1 DNA-processing protein DprA [Lyticum sinuosum]
MTKTQIMSKKFITDWLRIALTNGIGPKTFNTLIEIFDKNPTKLIENLPNFTKNNNKLILCSELDVEIFLTNLEKMQGKLILSCDDKYPKLLKNIEDNPPFLTILGRLELLNSPCVAIVGARDSSTNGNIIAQKLARDLVDNNITVVSGMARGIDASAHKSALNQFVNIKKYNLCSEHIASTIGVLASGIDFMYPRDNIGLYKAMYENGLIISEKQIGIPPSADAFPQRNRIISGLCLGVVVVEAGKRSGTLITAGYAADQGREVFAVPGSPLDNRSEGTNNLIKAGVTLVQDTNDILNNIYFLREKEKFFKMSSSIIPEKSKNESLMVKNNPIEVYKNLSLNLEEYTQYIDQNEHNAEEYTNENGLSSLEIAYQEYLENTKEIDRIKNSIKTKLSFTPTSFKDVSNDIENSSSELINIILTEMELNGQIERKYGNMISLVRENKE